MRQPLFDVSFYPFDYHTISLGLEPDHTDANLTNCASANLAKFTFKLSSEWWVDRRDAFGVPDNGACVINIEIRRNPGVCVCGHNPRPASRTPSRVPACWIPTWRSHVQREWSSRTLYRASASLAVVLAPCGSTRARHQ